MKWLKKSLAFFLILAITFGVSEYAFKPRLAYAATLVADTFTRANNTNVGSAETGGAWTETGGGASITSNTLRLGDTSSSIYQAHASLSLTATAQIKIVGKAGNNRSFRFGFNDGTTLSVGDFVSCTMGTNSAGNFIIGGADGASQTSVQRNCNTFPFWMWIEVETNGSNRNIKGYYSTTSTKPGSADLTLTAVAPSTGTNLAIFYDANAAGTSLDVDDVVLTDASAAATGSGPEQELIFFSLVSRQEFA